MSAQFNWEAPISGEGNFAVAKVNWGNSSIKNKHRESKSQHPEIVVASGSKPEGANAVNKPIPKSRHFRNCEMEKWS